MLSLSQLNMNHWNDLSITSLNFVSKGVQLMVILYDILIQLTISIIIFQRNQLDPGNGARHSLLDHLLFLLLFLFFLPLLLSWPAVPISD